jgi:hypothetical protein
MRFRERRISTHARSEAIAVRQMKVGESAAADLESGQHRGLLDDRVDCRWQA